MMLWLAALAITLAVIYASGVSTFLILVWTDRHPSMATVVCQPSAWEDYPWCFAWPVVLVIGIVRRMRG